MIQMYSGAAALPGEGGGETIGLQVVALHAFRVLGAEPVFGRSFRADEVLIGPYTETILISHALWQRRFGGDPDVVGQTLPGWEDGWGRVIIGVMPPDFRTTPWTKNAECWVGLDVVLKVLPEAFTSDPD